MSQRPVSQILLEDHHTSIRPGGKGECPFCHLKYFSLKADDTLGKCFHPACGRFLTMGRDNGQYQYSLARVLEAVYYDCHQELLRLPLDQQNAHSYLHDTRGIHAEVIADAMLGAVPSGYNITPHFQPGLDEAQIALTALQGKQRGRPGKQLEKAEKRLKGLQEDQQKLIDCFAHRAGWLVFFYTDAAHRCVALRLRQPYSRIFVSFKPGIAGVFGRELFTPFVNAAHQAANDMLLITEGEFNALQLQSLTIRYEETTGQPLGYVHACAVGGVMVADAKTIQRAATHPVVCYDHDANGAGFELVKALQKVMPVEACTTPDAGSDLDSYICDFAQDHAAAWEAVKALMKDRQSYGRIYSETGMEFFRPTARGKEFIPKWLGDAVMAQQTYRYTASQLWVYRDGVYLPCGEATLRADAQTLLGDERHERYVEETLRYVEVASRLAEERPPDRQHINLRNGRLDWKTGDLLAHTSAIFTTVQLPVAHDSAATCLAFDTYLTSTFDPDVIPLIHELLGWCLVPDLRFETAVMLIGEGENGKSVFLDLLGYLLGEDNTSNVALQDLEENRFKAAQLYGKLANIFADLDARRLQSSTMLKTLVTGDRIDAERKHCDPFSFRSYAKLLFSANKMPNSRDKSHAFYRRWLMIPFARTFDGVGTNPKPDKGLRDNLKKELPGILNYALEGLRRLDATETFTTPKSVEEAKAAYIRSNDNVAVFVAECVMAKKDATLTKKDFYTVYAIWCDRYGEQAVSQKAFKEALNKAVPTLDEVRLDAKSPWAWLGITWSADADAYLPPSLTVTGI